MSDPKIAKLESPVRSYTFRHLGKTSTVSFDERNLYVRCERQLTKGTRTHLLHHLSPKIDEGCWNEPGATTKVRTAWLLLLAAVVFYFSDLRHSVPLLVPALVILWAMFFASSSRRAWPYDWLTVGDEFGQDVVNIRAVSDDRPEEKARLDSFVRSLSKAIEEAKKNEYFPRQ